jgi:pyrroloquinoline quinone biosynthesis protein B
MFRVRILGSGAGGGFPQWNCACSNCERARSGDPAAVPRTQSSLAVSAGGDAWFLLNASPDLGTQIRANPPLQARVGPDGGKRHSPIAGAVLTNADIDHIGGLLTLRESQPLVVYATSRVHGVLRDNSVFRILNPDLVKRLPLPLGQHQILCAADGEATGVRVEAFPIPGKIALYLEDPSAGPNFGTVPEDTVALKVSEAAGERHFYYVPGCASLPPEIAERLRGAPLVFFDGTTWTDDEMITTGVGAKTGARMGHMSMSGEAGSIAAFAPLNIQRKVFIHINNTNPVLLDDSPERKMAEAAGWEIGFDGMEIAL